MTRRATGPLGFFNDVISVPFQHLSSSNAAASSLLGWTFVEKLILRMTSRRETPWLLWQRDVIYVVVTRTHQHFFSTPSSTADRSPSRWGGGYPSWSSSVVPHVPPPSLRLSFASQHKVAILFDTRLLFLASGSWLGLIFIYCQVLTQNIAFGVAHLHYIFFFLLTV